MQNNLNTRQHNLIMDYLDIPLWRVRTKIESHYDAGMTSDTWCLLCDDIVEQSQDWAKAQNLAQSILRYYVPNCQNACFLSTSDLCSKEMGAPSGIISFGEVDSSIAKYYPEATLYQTQSLQRLLVAPLYKLQVLNDLESLSVKTA